MDRERVLSRLDKRIDYSIAQVRKNESSLEYLTHKVGVLDYLFAAARQVHNGQHGFCRDCGRYIGVKRLAVAPGAIRCVRCQGSQG